MLEAKSMYHGGELVEAIDVNLDFDSYKELGLLCPFCNEPVFLCGETVKQSRKTGKLSYVRPHFKHFAGGDPMELTCEKRYYTAEGKRYLDAMRSERRGQRLDLFNRYFLEMSVDQTFSQIKKVLEKASLNSVGQKLPLSLDNLAIKKVREQWLNNEAAIIDFADELLATLWTPEYFDESIQQLQEKTKKYKQGKEAWRHMGMRHIEHVSSLLYSCDRKIHKLIVHEAINFLNTKQGANAWLGLIGLGLTLEFFNFHLRGEDFDWDAISDPARFNNWIVTVMVENPWQQQLEEKAKLKEQTRAKGFHKSA